MNKKILRNDSIFYEDVVIDEIEKARIGIVIDSTGSMQPTIDAVKGKVMTMI
jgi:hypothetical protein